MLKRGRSNYFILISFLIIFSAAVFATTGCEWKSVVGNSNQTTKPRVTTVASSSTQRTTTQTTATTVPTVFDPLTGLPSTNEVFARPVSVCIGNTPNAFPQYGPESADILVEAQVEGGITRLMAIISDYASLDRIGSVRSTRDYMINISNDFGAIALYAGTSDATSGSAIKNADTLDYIHQNLTSVYYRDPALITPHNLVTDGQRVMAGITAAGYSTQLPTGFSSPLVFAAYGKSASYGNTASGVNIVYSPSQSSEFRYNATSDTYVRGGVATVSASASTNKSGFSNVIILFCNATIRETGTSHELELDTAGSGTGLCFTGGTYTKINWSRRASDGRLQLSLADGSQLYVNRGRTYIGLMRASLYGNVIISG